MCVSFLLCLPPSPSLSSLRFREIERPLSPRDDDSRDNSGSEDDAESFTDRCRHSRNRSAADGARFEAGAVDRETQPPLRHDTARSSSAHSSDESDDLGCDDSRESHDDDEEVEAFGFACSGGGERGSYRGEDSDGEYGGGGGRAEGSGEEGEGSGVGGSAESFSLSGNSSEWTPLRGADFVSPSSRRDRSGDRFSASAPHAKVW